MKNPLTLINQIKKGYSKVEDYYFKHLTFDDLEVIQDYYISSLDSIKNKGIETNEQKLDNAIDRGDWSEEKETELKLIPTKIKSLQIARHKLKFPQQKQKIDEDIGKFEKTFKELKTLKAIIQYQSAEFYANNWVSEYQIYLTCYNSKNFDKRPWSYEDYQDLEEKEFSRIQKYYSVFFNDFNDFNLKKAAICPYFRNVFSIGSPFEIFNKPLIDLTVYQNQLLLYAKNFDTIFKNSENIPNELYDDPEELEKWFIKTQQEKQAGVQPQKNNPFPGKSLSSAIKEKGSLGIRELNQMQ